MTIFHIFMSIESAESLNDSEIESLFGNNALHIRAALQGMKARGMEVIPSETCTNFDSTGRCLGHESLSGEKNENKNN